MRVPSFALAALLAAVPAVRADDVVGVLAVAPPPGPGPELVELTFQLRQAMAERNRGVLEARQLRDRMAGQLPGASLGELDRAYEGARTAYANGDLEGSVRTLRAIIEDLEKLPDSDESFRQWTRATLRLAKAETDLGRDDSARALLERLVQSAPDVVVDRNLYPARFARQVDEVRARFNASPTRKLTITASEPGVKVFVNGRPVGSAPVTLALHQGRYRVSGAVGNLRAPPLRIDLGEEDQRALLDFTIARALRPGQGPGLALPAGDASGRIVAAGAFLGLDGIVAVSLAEEGSVSQLVGALYDVRRGMLTREGRVRLSNKTVPAGGIEALSDFLMTGQPMPGVVEVRGAPAAGAPATAAAKPPDLKPPAPTEKQVDLRPTEVTAKAGGSSGLKWGALGTGIAAVGFLGFGIAEALSASSSYDNANKLLSGGNVNDPATRAAYAKYVSDGNSAKTLSIVGYVGAGVAAVTTGVLGYLAFRQSGEFAVIRF